MYARLLLMMGLMLSASSLWAQGKVSGRVVDSEGKPLPYATIVGTIPQEAQAFTGATSDEEGYFTLAFPRNGKYQITIEFIGYQSYKKTIEIAGKDIQLGTITLRQDAQALEEVEVVAEKEMMQTGIGTLTYEVSKDLVNAGGSATDVLRNIPSVQVDENGALSLRGSQNVTILINGKQSALTGTSRQAVLERIPASSIERIEVITNPSARYDADGGAGIINIILKRPKDRGLNGTAQLSIGNYDRYNAGVDLNYQTPKWNIYGSLNGSQDTRIGNITVRRENFLPGTTPFLNQDWDFYRIRRSGTATAGIEHFINDKHSLRLEGVYGLEDSYQNRTVYNASLDADRQLTDYFYRYSWEDENENNYGVSLNYDWRIKGSDHSLSAYASYNQNWETEGSDFEENYFLADGSSNGEDFFQRSSNNNNNGMWVFQVDYKRPIQKNMKLEAGAKSIIREINRDFLLQDRLSNEWVTNTGFSNEFRYQEQVHAAYGLWAARMGKWEMEAGLRVEQTYTESKLLNTGETFRLDYFNLFPSAAVVYNIDDAKKVKVTYSRRINRPSFRDLNPFRSFSNPLVQRSGNPFLRPELTHSAEIGYQQDWDKFNITVNTFYKYTQDVIQGVLGQQKGDTVVYFPQNIASSQNYGGELILNFQPSSKLNWNISGSYYRLIIDGSNLDESVLNDAYAWDVRTMLTLSLPGDWRLQGNLFYRSPSATAQGTRFAFFMNGIGVSKKVLQQNGTLSLNVRDIAQSMRFGSERRTDALYNYFEFRGNTRTIMFSFQYTFGKQLKRRQNRNRNGDFDGGDFDGGEGM
ncbi:MAG: TonB-dependent receptor [Thermonema sp.]|nr:MAG: TonB-dependent receptor [Thermonema sp.]